jgi:hypothetical protein
MGPRVSVIPETMLVNFGQVNGVIVYPASESNYLPIAIRIQKALDKLMGVTLPIKKDTDIISRKFTVSEEYRWQNLILLGNLNNNHAFVSVAANFYAYSTCQWPGLNGFELRTVTNLYGTKTNQIIIGGSNLDSVSLAVDAFLKGVPSWSKGSDLIVPRLLKVVIDGEDQFTAEPDGRATSESNPLYAFGLAAYGYNITGSPKRLKVVRNMLEEFLKPGNVPAGADYGTESCVRALDIVDDTGVLSPKELKELDDRLLRWAIEVDENRPYWCPFGRVWSFGGHQACGALSFYTVVNYLLKNGNPSPSACSFLEQKREESRQFLNYLSTSFKDEQPDYGWETWTPLSVPGRYALAEEDFTWFESGAAMLTVKRHFFAGRGFYPAHLLAFFYEGPQYKSLNPDGGGLEGWAFVLPGARWVTPSSRSENRDVKEELPDFLLGTTVMPSSPTDYENAYRSSEEGPCRWYTNLLREETFHLIGFADGIEPESQMAVLSGWDSCRSPGEANTLRVFQENGHRFIYRSSGEDQRKPRPGRFYQNGVLASSGADIIPPPCAAQLLLHYNGDDVGMVASRLSNFNGIEWDRNVFWRRGRYLAIIDLCKTKKSGHLSLNNLWWSTDAPRLVNTEWIAAAGGMTFHCLSADPGWTTTAQWWEAGPWQLRQTKLLDATEGEVISFHNLLYVDRGKNSQCCEIRKVDETAMMVRCLRREGNQMEEELALIGVNESGEIKRFGAITTDAKLFFISPDLVSLEEGSASVSLADERRQALEQLWETLPIEDERANNPPAPIPIPLSKGGRGVVIKGGKGVVWKGDWQKGKEARWQDGNRPLTILPHSPLRLVSESEKVAITEPEPLTGANCYVEHPGEVGEDEDGALTWDIGEDRFVSRIDGIKVDSDKAIVLCSSDEFQNDIRRIQAKVGHRDIYVMYQYGFAAVVRIPTLENINCKARYFRIEVADDKLEYGPWVEKEWHGQAWNISAHNQELFDRPLWNKVMFRGAEQAVNVVKSLAVDIDGDGREEVVAATDNRELLVFNADGQLLWKRSFDGPILNIICEDMEDDRRREIIVSNHDNFVYCHESDGRLRFKIDLLEKVGAPANSITIYRQEDGLMGLLLPSYHRISQFDHEGKFLRDSVCSGFYEDAALPRGCDFNGDGVEDFVVRENVRGTVSLIDGNDLSTKSIAGGYPGKGLALIQWDQKDGGSSQVLMIAQNGVAMYRIGTVSKSDWSIKTSFSHPIAPITGWAVADINADGMKEILLGNWSGFVLILDENGKVLAEALAGVTVYDIATVQDQKGKTHILAATDDGLRVYDGALRLTGEYQLKGCVKIQAVGSPSPISSGCSTGDALLAFLKDGHVKTVAF